MKVSCGKILGTFSYKPVNSSHIDIPTSVSWLYNTQMDAIIGGYVNSNNLVVFDKENTKIISIMK